MTTKDFLERLKKNYSESLWPSSQAWSDFSRTVRNLRYRESQLDQIYDELYLKFDLDDQDKLGREIDPNTLDWWAKQDPAVMEEAFSADNRVKLVDAIDQFHKFAWGCDKIWSHGAVFDIIIIEDIYRQLNKPIPWEFWRQQRSC